MYPDLDQRPEFRLVRRQRFEIPRQFTTETYVGWLMTDSLVSSIEDDARQGFLNDIEHLVDAKYQGTVSRNWVYEIITAHRRSIVCAPYLLENRPNRSTIRPVAVERE
jgi:hypothetical protein